MGNIRTGKFGSVAPAVVERCEGCAVVRLAEEFCLDDYEYVTTGYRERLGQGQSVETFFAEHDKLQRFTLGSVSPLSLRGKLVADIGCGGGALLDHVSGLAREIVAIEPAKHFHSSLGKRGYRTFAYAQDAVGEYAGKVDLVFCIQVIEHVQDPLQLLRDIRTLLSPGGLAIVATPNLDQLLMDLLPDDYPSFFYRTVHRWYFDATSFRAMAERAEMEVFELKYVQRYSIGNSLAWLRDRRPQGEIVLHGLENEGLDAIWRSHLESSGKAETFYAFLRAL
ncbi:MAG: class I SAM-dependent methyltransferase [Pseudomonadota bacterium]